MPAPNAGSAARDARRLANAIEGAVATGQRTEAMIALVRAQFPAATTGDMEAALRMEEQRLGAAMPQEWRSLPLSEKIRLLLGDAGSGNPPLPTVQRLARNGDARAQVILCQGLREYLEQQRRALAAEALESLVAEGKHDEARSADGTIAYAVVPARPNAEV